MFTPNEPQFTQSGISGPRPAHWANVNAVDGDAGHWLAAGKGSTYTRLDLTNNQILGTWTKHKEDGRDDDWVEGLGVLTETVAFSDFTDGGSTAGTYVLTRSIPQGAYVLRTKLVNVTGFTGDTSATIQVGDGSDVDRYSTGTPSVFTTANAIDVGAVSGTAIHTAAVSTVTLTITSGSDWGAVAAGQLTVQIYYYN